MSADSRWMTRSQVADLIGFSPRTLETWATMNPQKGPPCFKVGNRYRYPVEGVRKYMAALAETVAA